MVSGRDVFPRNNLPGASVPWGRAVEEAVRGNYYDLVDLQTAILGVNQANAAQMGVIGRQVDSINHQNSQLNTQLSQIAQQASEISDQNAAINAQNTAINAQNTAINAQNTQIQGVLDELSGRSSHSQTMTNFSFNAGTSGGVFTSQTRTATLPAPSGGTRTAIVTLAGTPSTALQSANLYIQISAGGVVKYGGALTLGGTDAPSGWTNRFSAAFATPVGPGTTNVTVTVYAYSFVGGGNVQFTNVNVDSIYGDLV